MRPIVTKMLRDFTDPEDRTVISDFLDKVVYGKVPFLRRGIRILRENGVYTWTRINVMVRNYAPEEGQIEMLCINYDVTELKYTEFQLIRAKEKAEESDQILKKFWLYPFPSILLYFSSSKE